MNNEIILNTRINKLNPNDAKIKLSQLITWAYRRAGYKLTDDDIVFQVNELLSENLSLTLPEISKVFQNGLNGVYGDFIGLSVVTYMKWIKAFQNEKKQANTINLNSYRTVEEKKLTESDILRIENEAIQTWLNLTNEARDRNFYLGGNVFDILSKRMKLELPENFIDQAQQIEYEQLSKERDLTFSRDERNRIDKLLCEVINTPNSVINRAKNNFLKFNLHLFENL